MRSRTELVTTTFVESDEEEDYSPDDDSDSEEDWRPTKKRPPKQPRIGLAVAGGSSGAAGAGAGAGAGGAGGSEGSRKRKAAGTASKAKRRHSKLDSDDDSDENDDDDDLETDPSDEDFEYPLASTSKRPQSLPPKKQFVKLHQVDLLMKKADLLDKDWMKNTRLCLWRKDVQASLLQKFLRVKSEPGEEQLLFTSSSVYSSWDEQQIGDYLEVKANCLDPNNRRFKLHDLEGIMKVSEQLLAEQDKDDPDDDEEEEVEDEPEPELEPESEPVPDLDEEEDEDEEEAEDEGQEHTDETDP